MFPGNKILRGINWEARKDVECGVDEIVPLSKLYDRRVGREARYDRIDRGHLVRLVRLKLGLEA